MVEEGGRKKNSSSSHAPCSAGKECHVVVEAEHEEWEGSSGNGSSDGGGGACGAGRRMSPVRLLERSVAVGAAVWLVLWCGPMLLHARHPPHPQVPRVNVRVQLSPTLPYDDGRYITAADMDDLEAELQTCFHLPVASIRKRLTDSDGVVSFPEVTQQLYRRLLQEARPDQVVTFYATMASTPAPPPKDAVIRFAEGQRVVAARDITVSGMRIAQKGSKGVVSKVVGELQVQKLYVEFIGEFGGSHPVSIVVSAVDLSPAPNSE